jgi:Ca2+-binding RTX toxin-like protein
MDMHTPLAALAALASCAFPAIASGATVARHGDRLVYTSSPGKGEVVGVAERPDGYHFLAARPGPGCHVFEDDYPLEPEVSCDKEGIVRILVDARDRDDRVDATVRSVPVTVLGRRGDDLLPAESTGIFRGGPGDDVFWVGEPEARRFAGGAGTDTLLYGVDYLNGDDRAPSHGYAIRLRGGPVSGVENVRGSRGDDLIEATDASNRIEGSLGADEIRAYGGDDRIDATDHEETGSDEGLIVRYYRDPDLVKCDEGDDFVKADLSDRVTHGCERALFYRIVRGEGTPRVDVLVPHHFVVNGGDDAHVLRGRRDLPNHITGGLGDDVLVGGRRGDVLDGRSGEDDEDAGRGDDRLYARDGSRDEVRCGRGDDWVMADQYDAIAPDCERVHRRPFG